MRNIIIRFINHIARIFLIKTSDVTADKGSRVAWWRLGAKGGKLVIGQDCIVQCRINFDSPNGHVSIGDRSYIGVSHLVCHTRIEIAEDVIISWGVTIVDHNSHSLDWNQRKDDVARWMRDEKNWDDVAVAPIRIGSKSWIGFGATVLKGVSIGEGAVIGAMSVVTRDVPAYTVVGGNPARIIRELEQNEH